MSGSVVVGGAGETSAGGAWVLDPLEIYNAADVGGHQTALIIEGDVTIAAPANSIAAIIVLPPAAPYCKLRTNANSGDAGVPLNSAGLASQIGVTIPAPIVYPLGAGVNEIILNFASAFPQPVQVTFV